MLRENIIFRVTDLEAGETIKNFLKIYGFSRSHIFHMRNNDLVSLNGKTLKYFNKMKKGDIINIYPYIDIDSEIIPIPMDLDIIYEDFDYIAINKINNLVTHPTSGHQDDTLSNGLFHYFKNQGLKTIIHPITRLDALTSGIILFGKHPLAQSYLNEHREYLKKEYLLVTDGNFPYKKGQIDLPISRYAPGKLKRIISPKGKKSLTNFEKITSLGEYSILKACLLTGRTHQLRVHFSSLGFPIHGDFLYGKEEDYLLLHSHKLSFLSFRKKEIITLEAPLPKCFKSFIEENT